jgi:xeroderma pigmentosum group C-complementing protein
VVASEFREAVEEIIQGFNDERDRQREEMRSLAALKMWKRFLVGLRIKQRVDGYEVKGEEDDARGTAKVPDSDDDTDEYVDDDDGGGGFIPD